MNTQLNSRGVLLLAGCAFLSSCTVENKTSDGKKDSPISIQIGTPVQQSTEEITASGQIESQETAVLSTRVMGFISSIKAKPGDKVLKGQLLVTISNGDILAKRAQAQAMISEAEASLSDAQKDYKRFEELYKQQSASAKEFENVTLRYNTVKAKAEAAQQMKNEADALLAYTNLVSPLSGVVTEKHIDEGSMANPGMPILTIEQSNAYQVTAFVSETEVGKLRNGTNAEVRIKSTGKTFTGKLSEISPSSQPTGGQYQIKINVPAIENSGLFSGMYVNVNIPLNNVSGTKSLFVPASAIFHKDQLSGLYTVGEDQTAQLRWLKVGGRQGDQVEIISGLSPGEQFITQSTGRLYSGAPVLVEVIN